jgi:hypothetical protein
MRSNPWIVLCAVAACADPPPAPPPAPGPEGVSAVVHLDIPISINRRIDLLFVIDNSPVMAAHQANLISNYRTFMTELANMMGGVPDVHIGVVTTDLGTTGADGQVHTAVGACGGDGDGGRLRHAGSIVGNYITDYGEFDGSRVTNYTGSLEDAFAELATVGSSGCAFTQPLEAMRRTLSSSTENAGFLRDDAYLFVAFLTAGEDCSFAHASFLDGAQDVFSCITNDSELVPVDQYTSFLKQLKPDPSQVIVSGAFGPGTPFVTDPANRVVEPSCTLGSASATPARRLDTLLAQFPNRSTTTSICSSDLSDVMLLSGQLLTSVLGSPCLDVPLVDLDPDRAGTQGDCVAWFEGPSIGQQLIGECDVSATQRCWRLEEDPQNCTSAPHLTFRVEPAIANSRDTIHEIIDCLAVPGT